jgi:long-chain-alcohol oxidase
VRVELTRAQRRALDAITATFCPGAVELGVPQAFVERLAPRLRAAERRQLRQLLALFAATGFARRPPARRERILLAWADSRAAVRRTGFHALRKGVLSLAYSLRDESGGNPGWRRIGYPGPLGVAEDAPRGGPAVVAPGEDTTLDCDVCVVGSGAGGGVAAAVLAGAGLDVVVLEAGGAYDEGDFDGAELDGLQRLYLGGGTTASADQTVAILAGACLGGGTVVNYTTAFRTPDAVRAEWAGHGVPAFASDAFERALDAVCARLDVNTDHNRVSAREQKVRAGLEALGWHVDEMPRSVRGCDQGLVCGYCPFGCRLGAKQSATRTWLADAHAAGARVLVGTRAERVRVALEGAAGVEALAAGRHRVAVKARAVVAACGALHTPALLRRSGVGSAAVGRHLRLHPVAAVLGVFDEEIRPWEGTMQAIYSDEHADLDGGFGLKYETTAIHPGLVAAALPWRGASRHAELIGALGRTVAIGALVRDRDAGEVRVGRDGEPWVRYRLSAYDARHVRTGIGGAARILEAAGARRIVSAHARGIEYEPGRSGHDAFMAALDHFGYGPGACLLHSFHQMGTVRMGVSRRDAGCDPEGAVWGVRNLAVCDASTFPTASGVNPMVTVEAVAHLNASALAARLA